MKSPQRTIALSMLCGFLGAGLWDFASSLTAQAAQKEDVVESTEVRLLDKTGRLRARLYSEGDETHLDFFQDNSTIRFYENRRQLAEFGVRSSVLGVESGIWLDYSSSKEEASHAELTALGGVSLIAATKSALETAKLSSRALELYPLASEKKIRLSSGSVLVEDGDRRVHLDASGPTIGVADSTFSTQIGQSDLKSVGTGEKTTTSAASIVMFGEGGKVIWKLP